VSEAAVPRWNWTDLPSLREVVHSFRYLQTALFDYNAVINSTASGLCCSFLIHFDMVWQWRAPPFLFHIPSAASRSSPVTSKIMRLLVKHPSVFLSGRFLRLLNSSMWAFHSTLILKTSPIAISCVEPDLPKYF